MGGNSSSQPVEEKGFADAVSSAKEVFDNTVREASQSDDVHQAEEEFASKLLRVIEQLKTVYEEKYDVLPEQLRADGEAILSCFESLLKQSLDVAASTRKIYRNSISAAYLLKKAWNIKQHRGRDGSKNDTSELKHQQESLLNKSRDFFDKDRSEQMDQKMRDVEECCSSLKNLLAKHLKDLHDVATFSKSCPSPIEAMKECPLISLIWLLSATGTAVFIGLSVWTACICWPHTAVMMGFGASCSFGILCCVHLKSQEERATRESHARKEAKGVCKEMQAAIHKHASELHKKYTFLKGRIVKQEADSKLLRFLLKAIADEKDSLENLTNEDLEEQFARPQTKEQIDGYIAALDDMLAKADKSHTNILRCLQTLIEPKDQVSNREHGIDLIAHVQRCAYNDLPELSTLSTQSNIGVGSESSSSDDAEEQEWELVLEPLPQGKCYVEGTLLPTSDMVYKKVESFQVGDTVMSSSQHKLNVEYCWIHPAESHHLISLKTTQDRIEVSKDHRVVIPDAEGWNEGDPTATKAAHELKLGDLVICGGRAQPLTKISYYNRNVALVELRFHPDECVQTTHISRWGILTKGGRRPWRMKQEPPFTFEPDDSASETSQSAGTS